MTIKKYKIAVIPGDGVGKEVMPEGLRVLEAAGRKFGINFEWDEKPWSCDYYQQYGRMMPAGGLREIRHHDAILLGAVGFPTVPDHLSFGGLVMQIRREFKLFANVRPIRFLPGAISPLSNSRLPRNIDLVVVRENIEGEYSSIGGRMYAGGDEEISMQQTVFSRRGMDRVMRFAFELARKRERQHVTSCTKSNAIAYTMPHWDERFAEISAAYPDIRTSQFHIDALTGELVSQPDLFDVIVASTLFGEILSRVGSACVGPIGIAPSANLNPDRNVPSCFEPVHGSAPDIFGRGIANPIGQIWSGAMMLEHLGHTDAAAAVVKAIETVIAAGPRTADLGGKAYTFEVGTAIAEAL